MERWPNDSERYTQRDALKNSLHRVLWSLSECASNHVLFSIDHYRPQLNVSAPETFLASKYLVKHCIHLHPYNQSHAIAYHNRYCVFIQLYIEMLLISNVTLASSPNINFYVISILPNVPFTLFFPTIFSIVWFKHKITSLHTFHMILIQRSF